VKNFLANSALVLAGIIVALLSAEFALRVLGISYPGAGTFLRADYYTGWAHKPSVTVLNPTDGERIFASFNRYGMRDRREYALAKPARTFRIAVVGDSFTEALQVPQEKNFCSVVERRLARCNALADRRVEVLNFGVLGYGTGQELLVLRRLEAWSPDLVVIQFYINDLADNTPLADRWARKYGWSEGPRPFFFLRDGRLIQDDEFRTTPIFKASLATADCLGWRRSLPAHPRLYGMLTQSRLRQLLHHFRHTPMVPPLYHFERWFEKTLLRSEDDQTAGANGGIPSFDERFRAEAQLHEPPRSPVWRESWAITEALLQQMHQQAIHHGAGFLLVVASTSLQVYPDRNVRQTFVSDPFYLNRRLDALAQRSGFEVLSLGEPFQRYADEHHVFFHGFSNGLLGWGHWNERGHELAGEMIAAKICDMNR
jgi:GDSL-like lipase/acylhydrolase family protein